MWDRIRRKCLIGYYYLDAVYVSLGQQKANAGDRSLLNWSNCCEAVMSGGVNGCGGEKRRMGSKVNSCCEDGSENE
jgi:hypothetical protein